MSYANSALGPPRAKHTYFTSIPFPSFRVFHDPGYVNRSYSLISDVDHSILEYVRRSADFR
jgi:hypothetical protein